MMHWIPNEECPNCGSTDQLKAFDMKMGEDGEADEVVGLGRYCERCDYEWHGPVPEPAAS